MLRSSSAGAGGTTDESTSSKTFRVFTTKPSMIHLPGGGNKGPDKARRVRLFVSREEGKGQLAVYSEVSRMGGVLLSSELNIPS